LQAGPAVANPDPRFRFIGKVQNAGILPFRYTWPSDLNSPLKGSVFLFCTASRPTLEHI